MKTQQVKIQADFEEEIRENTSLMRITQPSHQGESMHLKFRDPLIRGFCSLGLGKMF